MVGTTRIHLDEVDGLARLWSWRSCSPAETDSDCERIASVLIERLGVCSEDLIEQAYVDLLKD